MLAPIPLILVTLLVLVLLVRVGMLVLSRRSRVERPSCGACGYPVAGLEGLRCPECGGELLKVGIQTPSMRRDPGPAAKITLLIVLWTLLLPIPAMVITGLAVRSLPTSRVVRLTFPSSGAYRDITIAIGEDAGQEQRAQVELRGNDGSRSRRLEVDVTEMTYRVHGTGGAGDAGGAEGEGAVGAGDARALDRQAVISWMIEAGVATSGPVTGQEADEMIGHIRSGASGGGASVTAGGGFGGVSWAREPRIASRTWFRIVVPGLWLIVWLAGALGIAHRYRGRDRAHEPGSERGGERGGERVAERGGERRGEPGRERP